MSKSGFKGLYYQGLSTDFIYVVPIATCSSQILLGYAANAAFVSLELLEYNSIVSVSFICDLQHEKRILTLVLLNPDIPCLCKQCRSRSVGFLSM